jgi:hypothetical protein
MARKARAPNTLLVVSAISLGLGLFSITCPVLTAIAVTAAARTTFASIGNSFQLFLGYMWMFLLWPLSSAATAGATSLLAFRHLARARPYLVTADLQKLAVAVTSFLALVGPYVWLVLRLLSGE